MRRAVSLNFVGALISLQVVTTIAEDIVNTAQITLSVVFTGLVGAIGWNLLTWYFGLPSSSSHAHIGGVVGAAFVAKGAGAVNGTGILAEVVVPAIVAPFLAAAVAALGTLLAYRVVRAVDFAFSRRAYGYGQVASGSLVSLSHGTNDAQKTMGVIVLALVASGDLPARGFEVPVWVIVSAASAMALGTYCGGWRIIRTVGHRLTDVESPQGFAAESACASVILASSFFGYPLSTTQVASGAVAGSGLGKSGARSVRWGVAGNIVLAWIFTLPGAAALAA